MTEKKNKTTLVGILNLVLFMSSLFFILMTPFEMYNVIEARSWTPTKVVITESNKSIVSRTMNDGTTSGPVLNLSIQNLETNKDSSWVRARFGGFYFSIGLPIDFITTMDEDLEKYPVGKELIAYKNPDRNEYVLEQNSLTLMLTIFFISLIIFIKYVLIMKRPAKKE